MGSSHLCSPCFRSIFSLQIEEGTELLPLTGSFLKAEAVSPFTSESCHALAQGACPAPSRNSRAEAGGASSGQATPCRAQVSCPRSCTSSQAPNSLDHYCLQELEAEQGRHHPLHDADSQLAAEEKPLQVGQSFIPSRVPTQAPPPCSGQA